MGLNLKIVGGNELDDINTLIVESEMASTNGKTDKVTFVEKYAIKKPHLLLNLGYVLYDDDHMVGFFMITSKGDEQELEYFYIEHNRLRKGYGKILWEHVIKVCNENNIQKIRIVCGKNVTVFYLKMGAEKIGEIDSKVNCGVKIDLLQYYVKSGVGCFI